MTELRHIFVFTDRRPEVAAFYREVIGVPVQEAKDDSVWFQPDGARLVVHEREEDSTAPEVGRGEGFVVWFGVADVAAAYERARAAGAVVGPRYGDYFFARDPEGRFVGVRARGKR